MSDSHGNTPAAWTAVTIVLLAFLVGSIGLMVGSMLTFWIGVALAPIGALAGSVMSKMGHGSTSHTHDSDHVGRRDVQPDQA